MPVLDRRITINITGPDRRNQFGEFVPGLVVPFPRWATRIDKSNEDIEQAGGVLGIVERDFIVRYDYRILSAPLPTLSVIDGPLTLNITNIVESAGDRAERRKFMRIQATGVAP